jgi:hypothetical protein
MDYPNRYKIIGYQVSVADSRMVQTRKTSDAIQVFGNFGGVLKLLNTLIGAFVGIFSAPTVATLMANRLYSWSPPKTCDIIQPKEEFEAGRKILSVTNTAIPLVPNYIFHRIILLLTGCCRKERYWAHDYQDMLDRVKKDAGVQLDIVTNLRRIRAHGFGLSMLLDKGILSIGAGKAKVKTIDPRP